MDSSSCLKILIFGIIAFFLISGTSMSSVIDASVRETINGQVSYLNITEKSYQKFRIFWENTGSVPCDVRIRMDIYRKNGSEVIYSGWSGKKPIMNSEEKEFIIRSSVPEGDYSAILRVYQCNEIRNIGPYGFRSESSGGETGVLEIAGVNSYEGEMEVFVSSSEYLENAYVVPDDYPLGWIVGSGETGELYPGMVKSVLIAYDPGVWTEDTITFKAVSEDGSHHDYGEFTIRKMCRIVRFVPFAVPAVIIFLVLFWLSSSPVRKR